MDNFNHIYRNIISLMKSAKHKVKDGKPHKKARVARFITSNFYFLYSNKIMNFPYINNPQPIPQPVSHRTHIPKQQHNDKKDEIYFHQMTHRMENIPMSDSNYTNKNLEQNTEINDEPTLEVETINKPLPDCARDIIPKTFDIVKRGSLPSIVFHNNKISILD